MEEFLLCLEEPRFGGQVYKWIYQKECSSFYEMSDCLLPEKNSTKGAGFIPGTQTTGGKDGSRKFLMELDDKKRLSAFFCPRAETKV